MIFFLKKFNTSFKLSDPNLLCICQWQSNRNEPARYYLFYRWILMIYFNSVVILSLVTAELDKNLELYMIFLTNWNVILNGISSSLLALNVTLRYTNRTNTVEHDSNHMTLLLKITWFLSSLSTVLAISLSLVYWPLIYTGRDKGVNDALTHAGNAIVLFIDLLISAHPPRFGHFIYHLLAGLVYMGFSIIYTLSGGRNRDNEPFIYTVLDWKNNTLSTTIFATLTLIFLVIMHFLLTAVIVLRIRIYEKMAKARNQNTGNTGISNPALEVY